MRHRALGADVDGSGYDVTMYSGRMVASRAGWVADAESRGGVITQVPGGFWHGIECARFGASPPFLYELPPVWLLVLDGVDTGTYEFLTLVNETGIDEAAQQQKNDDEAIWNYAKGAITGLPTAAKYAAIAGVALVAIDLLSPRTRRR